MPETIGVLALQGAFLEHLNHLKQAASTYDYSINAITVKTPADLQLCHALIIPGGESTVMLNQARVSGLLEPLTQFLQNPEKSVWGSCAGMILMAQENGVGGGKVLKGKPNQKGLGAISGLNIWRNAFGAQNESFEAALPFKYLLNPDKPFPAIFIRAPAVHSLDPIKQERDTREILCKLPVDLLPPLPHASTLESSTPYHPLSKPDMQTLPIVALKQNRKMITSFHPELSNDLRVHEWFLRGCVGLQKGA